MDLLIIVGSCIVLALLIAVIISFKRNMRRFEATIRLLTGSKQVIKRVKAFEIKDEKGVSKLKITKFKEIIQMPPDDAIEVGMDGKLYVEMYRDRFGNYAYVCDKGVGQFRHPINTNQQIILADQIIKAHSKNSGIMQHIPLIIGMGACVIIVIGCLLFVGEPLKLANEYRAAAHNDRIEVLTLIENIKKIDANIQDIKGSMNIVPATNAPN